MELRKHSPLFWFTLVIPIGIIGIGINFILDPEVASAGYGIPIADPNSFPYMWIKGIRDIFSGLVMLPFLFRGDRKVTSILFAIAIFVPFCDGLVIIANTGFTAPLLIHWGTAFYMIAVSYFLLRTKCKSPRVSKGDTRTIGQPRRAVSPRVQKPARKQGRYGRAFATTPIAALPLVVTTTCAYRPCSRAGFCM